MLAIAKVPNLKANHNPNAPALGGYCAVLATAKVPNLKANHNLFGVDHLFSSVIWRPLFLGISALIESDTGRTEDDNYL